MLLRRMKRYLIQLILCLPLVLLAAEKDFSPIEVKLVSEVDAILPGETFTVALHQKMLPKYHTYWKNPGTLGLPMSMKWELPDGFEAGVIQWPKPMVSTMAVYEVWGYEGEALLLIDIKAPKNLKPGTKVELKGLATWMCCSDQCFPAAEEKRLKLPVKSKNQLKKEWTERFDVVRSEQPVASRDWKLSASKHGEIYKLEFEPRAGFKHEPGQVRFFGYHRQVSSSEPQVQVKKDGVWTLTMQHEEYTGEEKPRLQGILVAENGWGENGPVVIEVDVSL